MLARLRRSLKGKRQFAGHYLISSLGQGHSGEVFLALATEDVALEQYVALKQLGGTLDTQSRGRFQREITILETLRHPNVVGILQHGECDDIPFFTMEALKGETLEALLSREKRLGLSRTVSLIRQAAEGLQALHQLGLIHRDIKPANLFLCRDGMLKVLDFGLAKDPLATIRVTMQGQGAAGTPLYMPPETAPLLDRQEVTLTPAYDQFSLAVVAYEMLTGARPFTCPISFKGVDLSSVYYSDIRALTDFEMRPMPTLEGVLKKALHHEPEKRFPSILEFARELADAARK